MADQQDAAIRPDTADVGEQRLRPNDNITVALAVRPRPIDVLSTLVEEVTPHAVEPTVVALAQTRISMDRQRVALKGDADRFERALEVRNVDGVEPIVAPPLAQPTGLMASALGQLSRQPTGGDAVLVVGRYRVGLVDESRGHPLSVYDPRVRVRLLSILVALAAQAAALLVSPGPALAHADDAAPAPTLASITQLLFEPLPWLAALLAAVAYVYAVRRVNAAHPAKRVPAWRTLAWLAGLATVLIALETAVDVYADDLLTVHMVQHLLLTLVAPPLLALGAPGTLLLRAADSHTRRNVLLPLLHSRLTRLLTQPVLAWSAFAIVMLIAHFTPLYDAALNDPLIHDLEHGLFLASGVLFWWPIVAADPIPHRMRHAARLVYLLAMLPIGAAVGLAIYFAPQPIYAHYATLELAWGPSPLVDQQIGGLSMWAAGNVLLLGAIALVVADWMRADERRSRILDARRAAGLSEGPS